MKKVLSVLECVIVAAYLYIGLVAAGCVPAIRIEEGTEHVIYRVTHPHATTQEISQ